jgi:hypothetical protein
MPVGDVSDKHRLDPRQRLLSREEFLITPITAFYQEKWSSIGIYSGKSSG